MLNRKYILIKQEKKLFVDSASICLHAEMVLELGPIYSNCEVIDYQPG